MNSTFGTVGAESDAERKVRSLTLHAEIREILIANHKAWMDSTDIAGLVNERGQYRKRDGSIVSDWQIRARARKYPDLFERNGSRIRCTERYAAQE